MTATSAQILRKAAEILPINKRCTGEYYEAHAELDPSQCPVCALGAIALAAGCDLDDMSLDDPQYGIEDIAVDAARALADELGLLDEWKGPGTVVDVIGRWNDRPTTTDADVLTALNATADALDGQVTA